MCKPSKRIRGGPRVAAILGLMGFLGCEIVMAADGVTFSGYVREHVSFNLENPPETAENDKNDLSMARTTLRVDANGQYGWMRFGLIARGSEEVNTSYLKRLQALREAGGSTDKLMDRYNKAELREAYVEFDIGDRTTMRLGKQQVAWGETDFFAGLDVVHGFDYTWRSFLEPENEELRKPLIMANTTIQVPEAKGSLQILLRPGRKDDTYVGNSYDLFGGRWMNQPNKGVDFIGPLGFAPNGLVPYNYRHPDGDTDNATGGLRWLGRAGPVNYSVAALRTFNPDPVVNVTPPVTGLLGEFIYPEIDILGFTVSGYNRATDAVWSTEFAYTKDKPYNVGSAAFIPGFGGIIKKDTLRTMLRMDKQVSLQNLLGTSRPSFFSVQLFDSWIRGFNEIDDIVDLAGWAALKKEHSTIATIILATNYKNDRINPTLALGRDLSYGGGFIIPSVEFAFGNHWRLRVEADIFFDRGSNTAAEPSNNTHLFGYFGNNDQLVARLSYLF
jgi:hypothetical protein